MFDETVAIAFASFRRLLPRTADGGVNWTAEDFRAKRVRRVNTLTNVVRAIFLYSGVVMDKIAVRTHRRRKTDS
jgi:hypothetical protein